MISESSNTTIHAIYSGRKMEYLVILHHFYRTISYILPYTNIFLACQPPVSGGVSRSDLIKKVKDVHLNLIQPSERKAESGKTNAIAGLNMSTAAN